MIIPNTKLENTKLENTKLENDIYSPSSIFISRVSFIFVIFAVISGGYVSEILSCQLRNLFEYNMYFRHIICILMFFVFIMAEGGWSFNKDIDDMQPNNWSSGNVIDTLIMSVGVYIIFLISSKSKLIPTIIFYTSLFILYCVNTYVNYLDIRKIVDDTSKQYMQIVEYILTAVSIFSLIYGFIEYLIYQKNEYGTKFNWILFLFGGHKCKNIYKKPKLHTKYN